MNTPGAIPDFLKTPSGGALRGKGRWIAAAMLALLAVLFMLLGGNDARQGRYLTEDAVAGKLTVTISASGTLQPTRSVDVGSELSGTLEAVLVEENERVKRGQVVARLDTAKLEDAVAK